MVSERVREIRSPHVVSSNSIFVFSTMAAASATPGHGFVPTVMEDSEAVEISVGGAIFTVGLVSE